MKWPNALLETWVCMSQPSPRCESRSFLARGSHCVLWYSRWSRGNHLFPGQKGPVSPPEILCEGFGKVEGEVGIHTEMISARGRHLGPEDCLSLLGRTRAGSGQTPPRQKNIYSCPAEGSIWCVLLLDGGATLLFLVGEKVCHLVPLSGYIHGPQAHQAWGCQCQVVPRHM